CMVNSPRAVSPSRSWAPAGRFAMSCRPMALRKRPIAQTGPGGWIVCSATSSLPELAAVRRRAVAKPRFQDPLALTWINETTVGEDEQRRTRRVRLLRDQRAIAARAMVVRAQT